MDNRGIMIKPICSYEDIQDFVDSFYNDPDFADPMLTNAEQMENNLLKSIRKPENHRVFGIFRENTIIGLFAFLVLQEEKYLEMLVGLSRQREACCGMFSYITRNFSGYSADFVFNPRNAPLRQLLTEKGAEFEPEQQKMVLCKTVPDMDTTGVEAYSQRYAQQYFAIHNKEMYWTGEKVAAAPERFRTFLAIEEGQVIGYIDVPHCFQENEPFDLFVLPEYRRRGWGRKLLAKAVEENHPKGMMLLVEVADEAAIRLYCSAGFVKADGPSSLTAHWKVKE